LYRRDTGEYIRSFSCYTEVKKIASDSSGSTLACAGADGSLRLLSPGGNDLDSCEGTIPPPRCLAVLKGKNRVVTGGWDGLLRLISIPEAKTLETFRGHTSIITSCAVSADGKFIVTGSNDTTVRLWSQDSRKVLQIIRDSNSEVGALGVSPDGYYFAAAGSDALIRIYSMPYGELVFSVPGISGAATGLAFSADGRILAAGYDTGTLLLISCPERKIVHTLRAHAAAVSTISVTPDGLSLVTGGREGLVRVWDLPSGTSLAGKNTNDIAIAARQEHFSSQDSVRLQWGFLRVMLSARFRNSIELCTEPEETGMFDIGIVG
jgi:WD40 repeat protein